MVQQPLCGCRAVFSFELAGGAGRAGQAGAGPASVPATRPMASIECNGCRTDLKSGALNWIVICSAENGGGRLGHGGGGREPYAHAVATMVAIEFRRVCATMHHGGTQACFQKVRIPPAEADPQSMAFQPQMPQCRCQEQGAAAAAAAAAAACAPPGQPALPAAWLAAPSSAFSAF